MYRYLSFDGLTLPTLLQDSQAQDVGTGQAASPLLKLPGGGVFDPFGSGDVRRGEVLISADGLFTGGFSAVQTDLEPFYAKIGHRGTLIRVAPDARQDSTLARLVAIQNRRQVGQNGWTPVGFQWQALSLPWSGSAHVSTGTPTTSTETITLSNNGNVNQESSIWTFTASPGTISGVSITNNTTGVTMAWSGTATAAPIVIDAGSRSVTANSVDDYAHFTAPTNSENWLTLVPGVNSITITYTGTITNVVRQIQWSDAWG